MIRLILTLVIGLCFFAGHCEGPVLSFVNQTVDFGSFRADSLQRGSFTIVNTGTDTLVINKVLTECSCTRVKYRRNSAVAPGDSLEISVTYDHSANRSRGSMSRPIRIISNSVTGRYSTVRLSGNVIHEFRK